jgi:Fe-S-cluster-containing dehydrogenase component
MNRYSLEVAEELCWGCRTCEVACKQENRAPDGVRLIAVREDGPRILDGRPEFLFRVSVCRHCEAPPCAEVCPAEAIRRRPDGIVVLDAGLCSGCGGCLEACPYEAIGFDAQKAVARKCNLCHHRLDRGLLPACADNVCPGHCIRLGALPGDGPAPMGLRFPK